MVQGTIFVPFIAFLVLAVLLTLAAFRSQLGLVIYLLRCALLHLFFLACIRLSGSLFSNNGFIIHMHSSIGLVVTIFYRAFIRPVNT